MSNYDNRREIRMRGHYWPMLDRLGGTRPQHGMSREEANELASDLSAAGIEVVHVDELRPGVFAPYYRLPAPYLGGWIVNPKRFRASVQLGLIEGIARDALGGARAPSSRPA
jgi:hypothetical protein